MSKFIFAQEKKISSEFVVASPLEADLSSGKWLVRKMKEIFGVEFGIVRKGNAAKNQKKVLIGTISESPDLRKLLEKEGIILGLNISLEKMNQGHMRGSKAIFQTKSHFLAKNKIAVAKSSVLRRQFLYAEDLGEQGFFIYKPNENTLILCGGSVRGTFYAVQTLVNHLYLENGNLQVENLHTERFPIFNQPAIPCRGVSTNIGGPDHIGYNQWVKEWEKEGEYDYEGFIDWLAEFKVTHLNIWLFELGFGIAYPSTKFPECVNKYHPNVKKEFIGKMIDYAHQRFMDVSMLIDFPDMFSGILRHHPELGAKQFNPAKLPPGEDWEIYQKTGENPKKHSFRHEFGMVCASNPKVMSFWENYLEEVFTRYPGLDGIVGQFAEGIENICQCENCQRDFLKLQWRYFKRMAEIAQKDRPERKIHNCASSGDGEILRHCDEIRNFVYLDWGTSFSSYDYGRACLRGGWFLFHYFGGKWHECDWKYDSQLLNRFHFEGIMKRTVSFKPCDNEHFAFGEFAWNPELEIEDYADLYVKRIIRKKDKDTSALYSHWIKAQVYNHILAQLDDWKTNKIPFSAKKIDREYPHLLREELAAVSSLLGKIKGENRIVKEIKEEFIKEKWSERL